MLQVIISVIPIFAIHSVGAIESGNTRHAGSVPLCARHFKAKSVPSHLTFLSSVMHWSRRQRIAEKNKGRPEKDTYLRKTATLLKVRC